MKQNNYSNLPLVYSCSGCSNIAQLANQIAIELDHGHVAEMSCIAGVGGGVTSLVNKAKSGREIISLDGCPLHCVKKCLSQHNIKPTYHYTLTNYGIKKSYHKDFNSSDVADIKNMIIRDINERIIRTPILIK